MSFSCVILVISILSLAIIESSFLKEKSNILYFISEIEKVKKSNINFYDKYKAFAGDFAYSAENWGVKGGNGDESVSANKESLLLWLHLEKAEFFNMEYEWQNLSYAKELENMPKSNAFSDCAMQVFTDSKLNKNYIYFERKFLTIRVAKGKLRGNLTHSCLSPQNIFIFDSKIDDGKAFSGSVYAESGSEIAGEKCVCDITMGDYCSSKNLVCMMQVNFL